MLRQFSVGTLLVLSLLGIVGCGQGQSEADTPTYSFSEFQSDAQEVASLGNKLWVAGVEATSDGQSVQLKWEDEKLARHIRLESIGLKAQSNIQEGRSKVVSQLNAYKTALSKFIQKYDKTFYLEKDGEKILISPSVTGKHENQIKAYYKTISIAKGTLGEIDKLIDKAQSIPVQLN